MHPYLSHLLEDIELAYREKTQPSATAQQPTDELKTETYFEEVERYVSGDNEQTFSYYCGLGSEIFPPADQFNVSEKEQVCTALENMFSSWNLEVCHPDKNPLKPLIISGFFFFADIMRTNFCVTFWSDKAS